MGRFAWMWLLAGVCALAGCNGDPPTRPDPAGPGVSPTPNPGAPPAAPGANGASARAVRAEALLPVKQQLALWYRVTLHGAEGKAKPRHDVAFFAAYDRNVGLYLESLGLGGEGDSLRLVVRNREIWILPSTTGFLSPRAMQRIYSERRGEGERVTLKTAFGLLRVRKIVHKERDLESRYWFGRGRGLVRMELLVRAAPMFTLELVEIVARGRPQGGYPTKTPAQLWASFNKALRRLDVPALERFMSPDMRAKVRKPGWPRELPKAVRAMTRGDPRSERIRLMIPDLLAVRLRPLGSWELETKRTPERATARALLTARVDGKVKKSEVVLVLERHAGSWKWAGWEKMP